MRLWIQRISLLNYRQYRNTNIEFNDPRTGKNFVVIQGAMGSGKTNILNAVTWCLYGEEKHITRKQRGLPIYNTLTAKNLQPGDSFEVKVEIQFGEAEDGKIIVTRSLWHKIEEGGKVVSIPDLTSKANDWSTIEIIRLIKKDMEPVKDPEFIIQKHIPEKIEEYFFFDGERLDDYFKEASGKKIAEAVYKISQIELFDRIIEHLKTIESDSVREQKNLSPKIKEIQDKIDSYQKGLSQLKSSFDKAMKEKDEAEASERELRDKLLNASIRDVKDLETERQRLENDINSGEDELSKVRKEQIEYLVTMAPSIYALKCLKLAKKLIDNSEAAGKIPPEYQPGFVRKLLAEGTCICGRDLVEGDKAYANVKKLLTAQDLLSEISKLLLTDLGTLGNMLDDASQAVSMLDRLNRTICERENQINSLRRKKAEIDEKLKSYDVDTVRGWEEELERWIAIRDKKQQEIGALKVKITTSNQKIDNFEKERESELRKQSKYNELIHVLESCRKVLHAAGEIKAQIMGDVRKEIEKQTNDLFLNMIWKKNTYKTVLIDPDYNVSVKHVSGQESLGTLSAGEREVLALSFVTALNNVSGFNVPIIMDTPLGRISRDPKEKVAETLPLCFNNKQVILLLTEEEYTSPVKKALEQNIAKEYFIHFKEQEDEGSDAKVIQFGGEESTAVFVRQ